MRLPTQLAAASLALAACAACSSPSPTANTSNGAPAQASQTANTQTVVVPPVSSAHGTTAPTSAAQGANPAEKPSLPTPEQDAKIEKAVAKAKAPNATDADKKAAAAAYVERANIYYSAQTPSLYKFALGDFRRALHYDPSNTDARQKMDQIIAIYQSMGRPVPTNGLDQ